MSAVEAWHTMRCPPCGRDRVHWRAHSRWRCIGTLPDRRYVADCAEATS